jgi:hypothetical protein
LLRLKTNSAWISELANRRFPGIDMLVPELTVPTTLAKPIVDYSFIVHSDSDKMKVFSGCRSSSDHPIG